MEYAGHAARIHDNCMQGFGVEAQRIENNFAELRLQGNIKI
jgi:hypothetical protein